MDTVILPAMTYGAETWTLTKTSREEACCSPTKHGEIVIEHHKERQDQERDNKIENRGDRYNRKSEVHERTVGRTCSQNEETPGWAKITSEWTPRDGKRLRGRPKRRWRDDIEEAVGSQWMRTAQDRSAWRKLWRPSASSGMNG